MCVCCHMFPLQQVANSPTCKSTTGLTGLQVLVEVWEAALMGESAQVQEKLREHGIKCNAMHPMRLKVKWQMHFQSVPSRSSVMGDVRYKFPTGLVIDVAVHRGATVGSLTATWQLPWRTCSATAGL